MKRKGRVISLSLALAGVLSMAVIGSSDVFDAFGAGGQVESCSSIVFGNTDGSSNGTTYYSSHDGLVGAYEIGNTSGSVTQHARNGSTTYPIKLGTSSSGGSFTITFSNSPIIETACFYVGPLFGTKTGTSLSLSTSLKSDLSPQIVDKTTKADLNATGEGTNRLLFSGLDNGSGTATTSMTIGNNGGTNYNNFYLYKIVFKMLSAPTSSSSSSFVAGNYDPITFNFMELGNGSNGDAIYIKAGENDILIDAGSRKGSAATIESYLEDSSRLNDYVSDGKLEYVIATHAHEDHIAGMVGNSSSKEDGGKDGILYHYKVDNLIDFSYYDDGSSPFDNTVTSTTLGTAIYRSYLEARNYAISKGTVWKTAGQIWNSGNEADRTISLGNGLTMTLLYNFYYDHTSSSSSSIDSSFTKSGFSDQNDSSVCLLFSQGEKDFLFTGDAESYAESSLLKYNSMGHVDLFKAGHHGSGTANKASLLAATTPSTIVVSCVAGSTEYTDTAANTFPYQDVIDRIAPYTDDVYVTSKGTSTSSYSSLNGNVVVSYSNTGAKTVHGSSNDTKLKDSEWFVANRTTPASWSAA